MNKVFLIGRLTDAPQQRQTPNGVSVTTFSIAVNRRFNREQTDYIPVVTWRGLADNCAKYLVKGQQVAVSGELQSRRYEDKDGNKRTAYEVSAEDVEFLSKPGTGTNSGGFSAPVGKGMPSDNDVFAQEMGDVLMEDEQLPF